MPSFRWSLLNLRCFLLPKHHDHETAGHQLNSVAPRHSGGHKPQHLAFRGSSLWKLYWQYTPLELPYPLPAGTFWVDDFPNFPLSVGYIMFFGRFSGALNLGQMTILHQPGKPLKTKRPYQYSFLMSADSPDFGLPKIIPYKARPWLNHNESLLQFSRLKIPQTKINHLQLENYWYLILRQKKHPRPCCGEVKFLVFGDAYIGKINTHLLF